MRSCLIVYYLISSTPSPSPPFIVLSSSLSSILLSSGQKGKTWWRQRGSSGQHVWNRGAIRHGGYPVSAVQGPATDCPCGAEDRRRLQHPVAVWLLQQPVDGGQEARGTQTSALAGHHQGVRHHLQETAPDGQQQADPQSSADAAVALRGQGHL